MPTATSFSRSSWKAPALNTVLYRYSKDEVKFILNYGRQNTPMPAWGAPGGGPLTEQQLDDVIAYLYSIQLPGDGFAGRSATGDRHRLQARRQQQLHHRRPAGSLEDAG